MKQSAAKTLGVAALGAAIAAVGAGAAQAAPATPQALDSVATSLPAENVTKALPGTVEAATQGQNALGAGVAAARPAVQKVLAQGPTAPVAGLLGGLPVGKTGLPTHGMGLNGLPLG